MCPYTALRRQWKWGIQDIVIQLKLQTWKRESNPPTLKLNKKTDKLMIKTDDKD